MFYVLELDHNTAETTKNICSAKGKDAVDPSTFTKLLKKLCSSYKNLDDQTSSGRPKTMESPTMLKTVGGNLVDNSWRLSGELDILQSSVVCQLHNLHKSYRFLLHIRKILQNFLLTLIYKPIRLLGIREDI